VTRKREAEVKGSCVMLEFVFRVDRGLQAEVSSGYSLQPTGYGPIF
jgi:hypothetical protein